MISEGCPGYFGDGGWAGETQPNLGFADLFGVKEVHVEFGENIHRGWTFLYKNLTIPEGLLHQVYDLTDGISAGKYADGKLAVVEHQSGKG